MTSPRRSTEALLTAWGERAQTLPPHLSAVHNTVLARVAASPSHPPALRPSLHVPWLSLACAGIAVLVLFIRVPVSLRTAPASPSLTASKPTLRREAAVISTPAPAMKALEDTVVRCKECGNGGFEEGAGIEYGAAVGLSTRDVRETQWTMARYGLAALFGLLALITASITWKHTSQH